MGKANISFPHGMLEEIDRRADRLETTRSGFVQEAVESYLARLDDAERRASRQETIERAKSQMRTIGARLPPGPDGVTIIRRMRDALPTWLDGDAAGTCE